MVSETTALENLKYAHAIDVSLDLSSQDVHELWEEIEARDKRRWIPVQDIKVGEIYLIDGHNEWDSDRGTEVLDGFTIAKYYGIDEDCRVFVDFYGTFLRFDMESDDLRNVYRLPEGA